MTFRFVGSESLLGPVALKVFGQIVEGIETADQVVDAITANCLPDSDYKQCGFTPLEESTYSTPGYQLGAPVTFIDKRKQAWVKLSDYRTAIEGGTFKGLTASDKKES